jgi:hypothetical protein
VRSGTRWSVGLGAALVAAAAFVPQLLPSLGLRMPIVVSILVAAIAVSVLVGLRRDQAADNAAARALDAKLDAALVCWPPRRACELTPYELGAHPTGDGPPAQGSSHEVRPSYVNRAFDDAVQQALAHEASVVLYGPARAGKTRSAFRAVHCGCREARLLVPEDADGLRTTLEHADEIVARLRKPPRGTPREAPALVLWLDELERFLPGLDLDVLDRLRRGNRRMVLVATVNDGALKRLLDERVAEPHAQRHRVRRLLGRSRAIHVPAPTAAELSEAGRDSPDGTVGSLPALLQQGWLAADVPSFVAPEASGRPTKVMMWGVVVVLIAALATAVVVGREQGWKQPKSIADQLADLKDAGPVCEQVRASPTAADAIDDRTLVVLAADRRGCGRSDELRLYRLRHDELRELATLRPPAADPQRAFTCIGATGSDPCAVRVETGARLVVGAFDDPSTYQEMPIALERGTGDALALASLSPRPPAPSGALDGPTLRDDRHAVALHLGDAARGRAPSCAAGERYCVMGHGAQAWATVSAEHGRPAVLLAGYLARTSTPEAPRLLRMRAWRLVSRDDAPALRQRCWIYANGVRARHLVRTRSGATANADLAIAWRQLLKPDASDVVC